MEYAIMAATHFTGPVYSANGFVGDLTGSVTLPAALTVTSLVVGTTTTQTGVATFTAQPIMSSLTASLPVFTDASKGLVSGTATGTGAVVLAAGPTLTGTIGAQAATFATTVGVTGLTTATGGVKVGATGATVTGILSASATLTYTAITNATQQDQTITVTGAAVGNPVILGLPAAPTGDIVFNAFVSATNTVTVRATNTSAAPITPGALVIRVAVVVI
jgi:hypothetical protein